MTDTATAIDLIQEALRNDGDLIELDAFQHYLDQEAGAKKKDTGTANADLGTSLYYAELIDATVFVINYAQLHLADFTNTVVVAHTAYQLWKEKRQAAKQTPVCDEAATKEMLEKIAREIAKSLKTQTPPDQDENHN